MYPWCCQQCCAGQTIQRNYVPCVLVSGILFLFPLLMLLWWENIIWCWKLSLCFFFPGICPWSCHWIPACAACCTCALFFLFSHKCMWVPKSSLKYIVAIKDSNLLTQVKALWPQGSALLTCIWATHWLPFGSAHNFDLCFVVGKFGINW